MGWTARKRFQSSRSVLHDRARPSGGIWGGNGRQSGLHRPRQPATRNRVDNGRRHSSPTGNLYVSLAFTKIKQSVIYLNCNTNILFKLRGMKSLANEIWYVHKASIVVCSFETCPPKGWVTSAFLPLPLPEKKNWIFLQGRPFSNRSFPA